MPFVLDASVTLTWAFEDDDHPRAALALQRMRSDTAIVPALWWFEVRSSLVVNERRDRLSEASTAEFLNDLSRLHISVDRLPEEHSVLRTARRHRITFYDAAYLELAQRERIAIATLDQALAQAARAEQVPVIGD